MKFQIEIDMDNAAFKVIPNLIELSRILIDLTEKLSQSFQSSNIGPEDQSYLLDINGNIVGFWKTSDE
jgi:hypothetical protein